MNDILSLLIMTLVAMVIFIVVSGCTSVGSGVSTLITAKPETDFDNFKKYFPDLVSSTEEVRQLPLDEPTIFHKFLRLVHYESPPPDKNKYNIYQLKKLGSTNTQIDELSVVVRDRSKLPPFISTDGEIEFEKVFRSELLKLYLKNESTSDELVLGGKLDKDNLAERAKGKLMNVPDVPIRTVSQETKLREFKSPYAQLYFYFPRIQIDFSSRLRSHSQLDRFDYVGMVVRLKNDPHMIKESACGAPRIINFDPKAADIIEFSRGVFTQKADINAKTQANLGKKETGTSLGQDMSITMSETFVNSLNDSIESRTGGILDQGQTFFTDFRAIKNKRIGGTYSYDIMLEVPASLEEFDRGFLSRPCCTEIRADIYLIGVVRHVYHRGSTGIFYKVPEPDNDKTFLQVVHKLIPDVLLWKYNNEPWGTIKPTRNDSSSK